MTMAGLVTAFLLVLGLVCMLQAEESDVPSTYHSGTINDGKWSCPWTLSGLSCADGKFECTCPGDGKKTHFKIGCCYEFPQCGKICNKGHACNRYSHCKSCRSGVGEWDWNACLTCKQGFVLGTGSCRTDLDECLTGNGGCESNCHNTHGSFYCSCQDGFQLLSDSRSCGRLSCGEPSSIAGGSVRPTSHYEYSSYAVYSCDQPVHVTVGSAVLKCVGGKESAFWDLPGQVKCEDTCSLDPSVPREECGPTGVGEAKCEQLGCCFDSNAGLCFHKKGEAYVRHSHSMLGDMAPGKIIESSSVDGCAYQCDHESPECNAFGMLHILNTEKHGVSAANCQLFTRSVDELQHETGLMDKEGFDFYTPLRHPDGNTFKSDQARLLEKLHLGCFGSTPDLDPEVHSYSDSEYMTASKCISSCRDRGMKFAILKSGHDCYCSSGRMSHSKMGKCETLCSGDLSQSCGGESSSDIYTVPKDRLYLGCYSEMEGESSVQHQLWDETSGHSVPECIRECSNREYPYAFVHDGGSCKCGSTGTLDQLMAANETTCSQSCGGYVHSNCGGKDTSAMYRTEYGLSVFGTSTGPSMGKLYDTSGRVTGVSTNVFTIFPGLRSFVTKRLVLHSNQEFQTPVESGCYDEGCFSTCGEIFHDDINLQITGDITIRAFFIRLSQLNSYVGPNAKRVFVYAQTLLIDQDLHVNHALLVKARQILLDRSSSFRISVNPDAEVLPYEMDYLKNKGPDSENLFLQQSYMCARILMESRDRNNVNTAWSMLRDISGMDANDKEQKALTGQARSYIGELIGMGNQDLHYIPLYTKSHMSSILKTYYDSISIYKTDYDRLRDQTTSSSELLTYASRMQDIYSHTDVEEARVALKQTTDAIRQSDATYKRMELHYNLARKNVDASRENFAVNLEASSRPILKLVGILIKSIGHIAYGIATEEYSYAQKGLGIFINETQEIDYTMEELAKVVRQIDHISQTADETVRLVMNMSNNFEYEQYVEDLEIMVSMEINLVLWKQMKDQANIILADPNVLRVSGCKEYTQALMELCNWGESLTRSMVEKAELMRQAIEKRAIYEARLEKQSRISSMMNSMGDGIEARNAMLLALTEQTYDIRISLNAILHMFCRAYFYENLQDCNARYRPSFGGSLSQLLVKISAAQRDELFTSDIPSSVSRIITITDKDTDPACRDATVCPVNYFRNNKVLIVSINVDHGEFSDLSKYRMGEIAVTVEGARPKGDESRLKLDVESTGQFLDKARGQIYHFITKPISLSYEYDLKTGHVSIRADVYNSLRQVVSNITPFTTWHFTLSELRADEIDLSGVTSVKLRMDGGALTGGRQYSAKFLKELQIE